MIAKKLSPMRQQSRAIATVRRKSYVRIDPKYLRTCLICKRKNARVQLIPMTRTKDGHAHLQKGKDSNKAVNVCDRKSCIAKALEKKRFDFWVKIPIGEDIKSAVLSN